MKHFLIKILFLLLTINVCAQTSEDVLNWQNQVLASENIFKKEYKDSLTKYDFSPIWTFTDNHLVVGFIGENYQRIRIKFISISKDKKHPNTYNVIGKSMVKGNICNFEGTIKITKARIYKHLSLGEDNENDSMRNEVKKQGFIFGEYYFSEDSSQMHPGTFSGILYSEWYINKNNIVNYDDLDQSSDSYANNKFVGTWKGYINNLTKICNWGDYRIPFSGNFDVGTAEFSPGIMDSKSGWQNYRYGHSVADEDEIGQAGRKEETREWWK